MFKFISVLLTALLMSSVVFADNVLDNKALFGYGSKVTMYSTNDFDVVWGQGIGFSFKTASGFIVPDESYVMFSYSKGDMETDTTTTEAKIFEGKLHGVWYLTSTDSTNTSKFHPFFILSGNYEVINPDNMPTDKNFYGEFGLGLLYKVNDRWGLFTTHTLNLGESIEYRPVAGIFFELIK